VTRSYEFVLHSAGSPQRVWELLADGAGWSQWAGPMIVRSWWEREGEPAPGGVGAIRALGLPRLGSREQIVAFDPPTHLAYTILSGAPVRGYRADVDVEPDGGGTRIRWRGTYTPTATWAAPLIHLVLTRAVRSIGRHLARAAARG